MVPHSRRRAADEPPPPTGRFAMRSACAPVPRRQNAQRMNAHITTIPTLYATMHLCTACDVCGAFGCDDSHDLCDAVNPERTEGCFREPLHEGLHTFEIRRTVMAHKPSDPSTKEND